MAKRVKVGSKAYRAFRRISILVAVLTLVASFGLIGIMVVDIIGFNIVEIETPRVYWIQFESEERLISDVKYKRGEAVDIPPNPKHSDDEYYKYEFRGWDLSGDGVPDHIPTHAFYSFLAVAVYQRIQVKPIPKSSSEEPSSESDSIADAYLVSYIEKTEVSNGR